MEILPPIIAHPITVNNSVLDISSFGMGIGVVLAGWVAGMVVGYIFSIVRNLGKLQ